MKKKIFSLLMVSVMVLSMSANVFASAGPEAKDEPVREQAEFDGQGYIASEEEGNGNGVDDMIDIEIPTNGFFWYANEDTYDSVANNYDIKSAEYSIKNNSETINLEVTLVKYEQSGSLDQIEASGSEITLTDLSVGLAGDLYNVAAMDLLNDPPSYLKYENLLGAETEWSYSFTGKYDSSTLPSESHTSDYVLVLQFEAVSSTGQRPDNAVNPPITPPIP